MARPVTSKPNAGSRNKVQTQFYVSPTMLSSEVSRIGTSLEESNILTSRSE